MLHWPNMLVQLAWKHTLDVVEYDVQTDRGRICCLAAVVLSQNSFSFSFWCCVQGFPAGNSLCRWQAHFFCFISQKQSDFQYILMSDTVNAELNTVVTVQRFA